jgi:uncharacterized protein (TIGR02271 family)
MSFEPPPADATPTPTPASGAVSVVRAEEQALVRTVSVPNTRLRIRKVIVTEERTITVHVRREELRITEHSAADTTDDVNDGSVQHHDEDFVLVLSEEQIDVRTRIVPVERVTIVRTQVTTPQNITTTVAREQVDVDMPAPIPSDS